MGSLKPRNKAGRGNLNASRERLQKSKFTGVGERGTYIQGLSGVRQHFRSRKQSEALRKLTDSSGGQGELIKTRPVNSSLLLCNESTSRDVCVYV